MTRSLNLPRIKGSRGAGYLGYPQYRVYGQGSDLWRIGVRDGSFIRDQALTAIGFFGTENTDWINRYEES